MWKKLGILVFLSVLLGEPKFQSEEGDSGIHNNPNLLGPSECGRSCSISGFLCHWRMLAEGTLAHHLTTTCPDHVLTSMFFTCARCEGCEITCENPDSKADQGRSTLNIHPPDLGRTRNI